MISRSGRRRLQELRDAAYKGGIRRASLTIRRLSALLVRREPQLGAASLRAAKGLTLETYILEGMLGKPNATGAFTSLLNQFAFAAKQVSSRVRRAELANVLGYTGALNVQGEQVQKLDEEANETIMRVLGRRHHCAAAATEEEEGIRVLTSDHIATSSLIQRSR